MPRFSHQLVVGVVVMGILGGTAPAGALASEADPTQTVVTGLTQGVDLQSPAQDVTESDHSLKNTTNEVSVLVDHGDGSPTVTKLRTATAAEATELASSLDSRPGVVAAPTTRLQVLAAPNPEPMAASQWNLPMVGATDAWAISQGARVVVAVIDTGVDGTHPDLAHRVLPEIDLLPDVSPTPEQNGHGTRVASIIAGSLNAFGIAGVAPQATILPVSALDPEGFGDSSTVARAIIAAADAGARVINLSLGGPDKDPVLDRACAYATAKGSVVVAAGGNTYLTGNRVQYPAASPHVLAVASVDRAGNPSDFTNTGSYIDIAAPGEGVVAAIPGGTFDEESGSSFAAPHVAGTLALVLSANPGLNATEAAAIVKMTATPTAGTTVTDRQVGRGILRADSAVASALKITPSATPAYSRVRLRGFDAVGEPARRGRSTTFTVTVQTLNHDGVWRTRPVPIALRFEKQVWKAEAVPILVRFEFRPEGARKFRKISVTATGADGRAVLRTVPPRSGTWRARVQQPNGSWTASSTDYLKVRR